MNERYSRQIMLPEIGEKGQQQMSEARVLIVGVGGLGSPTALYLTAAGIGHLGLVDADTVSLSNLQRQVLYHTDEVGESKALCAQHHLHKLSPHTHIEAYDDKLTSNNAATIISHYDIVVDGCDNAATRYLIDDECARQGKPYVYGAISEYVGLVSVFDARQGWRYIDLYPDKAYALSQPQQTRGVIGTLPGIIGTVQATEVIKLITHLGTPLIGSLFSIDIRSMATTLLKIK